AGWVISRIPFNDQTEFHVRGLRYEPDFEKSVALLRAFVDGLKRKRERRAGWFNIHPKVAVPPSLTNTGVLCVGAVGAGKTNFLLPFLQQIAASPHRSFILDIKGDFTEKLLYPDDRFILIAPWDERGWRWDIAKDINSLSQARLFAESCVPPSEDPIWSTAARQIFAGLMNYLCLTKPGQWDLLDFIHFTRLSDEELVRIVHDGNPDAERTLSSLQKENRTGQSIMINLTAFMGPLADLAWAWREGRNLPAFSIDEWLSDGSSLPKGIVLQSRRRFGEVSEALTNAMVTLLTDRIVDVAFPEADARKSDWRLYMSLDEIAQSRKIEALQSLSSAGRSKGLHLLVGIQSITQLKKIYGPEFADLLYTNLLLRYIGRTPDGDSAEWLASKFGQRHIERLADSVTYSASEKGPSTGFSWHVENRDVLLPSQLGTELGPDFRKGHIRALLSVAGFPYVLRLAWPKAHCRSVRPALLEAPWVVGRAEEPDVPEGPADGSAERAWARLFERGGREPSPSVEEA
ncbi:MAG: type IV secretion system DNA-binding domain-containing protein, partial [Candidatus Competibacteraceae bacterium]|nr:type IV secretion system DNA-binding domain-containing protein [Candidatus Competibacteraceae bacterium]